MVSEQQFDFARSLLCKRVIFRGGLTSLLALAIATASQAAQAQDSEPASPLDTVPAPPPDAQLPQIERIISDEELEDSLPSISPDDDPEMDRPLESIEEFERNLAAQEAGANPEEGQEPPLGDPALADGDPVEQIGDAPVRDAELIAPLPPLETFNPEPVEFAEAEADRDLTQLNYGVLLTGLEAADKETPANLSDLFNDLSTLKDGAGKASNLSQIRARLTEDSATLKRILASEGWYDAQVNTRLDRSTAPNGQPLTAVLEVAPGERFVFAQIDIQAEPTVPEALIDDNFAVREGEPIVATRVQGAEAAVAVALPENGYPFAEVGQRDILLDQETGDGIYTLPIDTGPRSKFGEIRTTGDLAFGAEHIEVIARFERGQIYNSAMIDDLRKALVATGLFRTISVTPERTGEDAGEGTEYATILVDQQAGPPRTIAGSLGFGTGEGFRLEGSWTHRNLFPPEGALTASLVAGTNEQGLGVTFRRANAGKRDRTVLLTAEVLRSDLDAFEALTGRLSGLISYDSTNLWQKPLTYAYGAQLIGTIEEDFDVARGLLDRRTFFIGGLIGQIGVDQTDSLLNATKGYRLTALIEPEGSLQGNFSPYVRLRLDGSAFYSPTDSITLAGRLRLGTIQGIDRFDLAPSRRFYGGGGGSVRGFGFQQLGPRATYANPDFDPNDPEETDDPFLFQPLGGVSLNEVAAEVRYRFGDFGVVAFVDAGQVYETSLPDFSGLRFGAGLGGRYYTNFGPLRLDIAIPIDRREGESAITVYVSIGQAF